MSDYDRGAYTPPHDEPLAFDARAVERRRPMPMTLVASAVILVVLTGAVAMFYQSGVRGANEPPRAVGQSVGKIKVLSGVDEAKPVDEALDVYGAAKTVAPGTPKFTTGPEQPQPLGATSSAPAKPVVVATAPLAPAQAPDAVAAPAVAVSKPAKPAPVKVAAAAAAPDALVEAGIAPAPKAAKPSAAASGHAMVQIGAFSSTEIADQEYAKVRTAYAKYTSGKAKHVEPVDRGGKTLYRTAFTGFTPADAEAFCAILKAQGHTCVVK